MAETIFKINVLGIEREAKVQVNVQTPIQVILLVAGTTDPVNTNTEKHNAGRAYWASNPKLRQQLKEIADSNKNIKLNYEFYSWSGDNQVSERGLSSSDEPITISDAGNRLRELLYARKTKPFYQGWLDIPVHFHLIGHSHGGNVMNEFTHAIKDDFPDKWRIKSLTYLSTPFFRDLHPIDGSKLHKKARLLNVYNQYDITQQTIANYSVISLEDVATILPIIKSFAALVINEFIDSFSMLVDLKGINEFRGKNEGCDERSMQWGKYKSVLTQATFFWDSESTAQQWDDLAALLVENGEFLSEEFEFVAAKLKAFSNILPKSLIQLLKEIIDDYRSWSLIVKANINRLTSEYRDTNFILREVGNYFSPTSFIQAISIDVLIEKLADKVGRDLNSSVLFTVLDDLIEKIISTYDDTDTKPFATPKELLTSNIKNYDVTTKDPYHEYGQSVFPEFLSALESNQAKLQQAVDPNNKVKKRELRLDFILMLLAQMDYSILIKLVNNLDSAQWVVIGDLDTSITKLENNIEWIVKKLEQRHHPLMVTDDLLLHYCLKYLVPDLSNKINPCDKNGPSKIAAMSDWLKENDNIASFSDWLESNVKIEQTRLLARLNQLTSSPGKRASQLRL